MQLWGARQAIHDATALHLRNGSPMQAAIERAAWGVAIDSSPRINNDYMIVDLVEAGRVMRVVDEQPISIRSWLLYAYAAERDMKHRDYLAHAMLINLHADEMKQEKRAKLGRLGRLAIDDYRMRTLSGGEQKRTVAFLAAELGVAPNHWNRDGWPREMRRYHEVLEGYDRRGLAAVGGVVHSLRSEKKAG